MVCVWHLTSILLCGYKEIDEKYGFGRKRDEESVA